jgi:hypothetical protein
VRTTRHALINCPACGADLEASTSVNGDYHPKPGDLSMCVYCTSFLCFTQGLALRMATEAELAELDDDSRNLLLRSRKDFASTEAKRRLGRVPS